MCQSTRGGRRLNCSLQDGLRARAGGLGPAGRRLARAVGVRVRVPARKQPEAR